METPGPPLVTTENDSKNNAFKDYNATVNYMNYSFPKPFNKGPLSIIGDTVYISVIFSLEIPIICLAIYGVFSLIKSKQAAPVFVINLLISDLIQIVCVLFIIFFSKWKSIQSLYTTLIWAAAAGLSFMTCIAIERYVLIAHPIWYRSHRSVTCFVCTSLTGWLVSFSVLPVMFMTRTLIFYTPIPPYAVIILCFVGSCWSLSHSISLTPLKKQLVLAPLFFVVMSYTFLILPFSIVFIAHYDYYYNSVYSLLDLTMRLYLLNPLVDCLLYVFMRSDAENIIRTPLCCSRLKRVRTETGQTTSTNVQRDHV